MTERLHFHFTFYHISCAMCLAAQLCLTLCDPLDCSPPASSGHEIFQVRILEQLPFLHLEDLCDSGIESTSPISPELQADSLNTERSGKPYLLLFTICCVVYLFLFFLPFFFFLTFCGFNYFIKFNFLFLLSMLVIHLLFLIF